MASAACAGGPRRPRPSASSASLARRVGLALEAGGVLLGGGEVLLALPLGGPGLGPLGLLAGRPPRGSGSGRSGTACSFGRGGAFFAVGFVARRGATAPSPVSRPKPKPACSCSVAEGAGAELLGDVLVEGRRRGAWRAAPARARRRGSRGGGLAALATAWAAARSAAVASRSPPASPSAAASLASRSAIAGVERRLDQVRLLARHLVQRVRRRRSAAAAWRPPRRASLSPAAFSSLASAFRAAANSSGAQRVQLPTSVRRLRPACGRQSATDVGQFWLAPPKISPTELSSKTASMASARILAMESSRSCRSASPRAAAACW